MTIGDTGAGLRYGQASGRWVLLATVLGSGMAFIDGTVVTIALPQMAADLGDSPAGLQWVANGYTLPLAAFILLGGSLGDRFGRRRVFMVGVTVFAVASLLCSLATSIGLLVAARALQGVGGALLTPGSLSIIQASFAPSDRGRAIGAWSGLAGVAGAIGPLLGGVLVEAGSWRLVFLINVPVAAAVLWVTARHVPESADPDAPRGIDVPGAVLCGIGLGGLTYGLTAWSGSGGGDPLVVGTLLLGVVALGVFLGVERRSRHPLLPLGIFASRIFRTVNLVTFAVYAALGGVFFLVVVQLQVVSGFTPLAAGLALLPLTLLMLLLSARAGALATLVGPRLPMTVGPLACAVALVLASRIGPGASYVADVLPAVTLLGLGLSLTVAPLTSTALGAVEVRHAGAASGVNNAVARTAGLLAVALLPLLSGVGSSLTDPATLEPAFRTSMLICAGLMVAGAVVAAIGLPRGARARPPAPAAVTVPPCRHCAIDAPPLVAPEAERSAT
ncbi:DHA2 family efflux MFS transporter permease subunit [Blastococcus sp. URHD0036]|uniref:DHA2 family efflux MFS transporter permease subunit n=1 Tax=Blastococcus sp. URHD0036 TaxID=1380356 RepID=UPI0004974ABE|nr:DHA2 family efflux MFS transporter permease subunit [Blastococcus sp. URHD0036]